MCYVGSCEFIMKHAQKQKTLLPTLKEEQRYLVYGVKSLNETGVLDDIPKNISPIITKECVSALGVFESAKAGIMNVKYDEKTRKGILRVERKYVDKLKVILGMITTINDKKVNINCIYVSGMLNKAESKISL